MTKNLITTLIGDKRRWRAYRARVKNLPPNYREAVDAVQRYLMYFGPMDAKSAVALFDDVADLFERAAADGTPIRQVVGDDPVEFVEDLIRNYSKGGYVARGTCPLGRCHRSRGRRHDLTAPAVEVLAMNR